MLTSDQITTTNLCGNHAVIVYNFISSGGILLKFTAEYSFVKYKLWLNYQYRASKSLIYLWWVSQVEGMVNSEVYEPQESGVQLCKSCHHPVVDICWVLKEHKTEWNQALMVIMLNNYSDLYCLEYIRTNVINLN